MSKIHLSGNIGFLGTGNMAEAIIRGLLRGGDIDAQRIGASAPRAERRNELEQKYGLWTTGDNLALVERSDVLVLSVKPQIMRKVLEQVGARVKKETLVISVAAGVPISAMESRLPAGTRVIRTMPNTPALVDAGATAISSGTHATEADVALAKQIFDAVGVSVVLDEYQLDAVTGLSGSGPAYVFLILEALADGGVKVGLSRRISQQLAAQTVLGAAKLLIETNEHPGRLKDMVTSPGGTAIAGLHTLEAGGMRTTLMDAVEAATKRSRELGASFVPDKNGTENGKG
jgi:pyrroline-5-carboxylate reductase